MISAHGSALHLEQELSLNAGRTLLEHLLAAVRRTLPGSAVRARRLGQG